LEEGKVKKRLFFFCVLLLMAFSSISYGWELSMTGEFDHRFRSISRSGTNDLFGNTNTAQSELGPGLTTIGLSGPWNRRVVPEGLSSKGSIGTFNEQQLIFYPEIKINRAIKMNMEYSFQGNLNGLYQGGSNWTNPPHYAGWVQMNSRRADGFNGFTTGILKSAWVTTNTPIGTFRIGRYPFGFGLGWSGLHQDDFKLSMITMTVPYGPMEFVVGMSLSDNGGYSDPYDTRNANRTRRAISSTPDRNEIKSWDTLAAFRYRQSNFDFGFLHRFMVWNGVHAVPWSSATLRDDAIASSIAAPLANGTFYNTLGGTTGQTPTATTTSTPLSSDVYFNLFVAYMKYNQGRFFLNAEFDQEYISSHRRGARPVTGYPKSWMIELGTMSGPAKVTLANFYRTGHQRSGGELNFAWTVGSKTGGVQGGGSTGVTQLSDKWNQFIILEGAHAAMIPYNFIIGYYGTGNNSYDASGYPTYKDYIGFAVRGDYAVASNLNLFASYLWSHRQSNTGSWWGQYSGGVYPTNLVGSNVPDNNLGPEWNVGFDWKLLENFTLGVKGGGWYPGDWFKYAYTDLSTTVSMPDPTTGNAVFVNPGRSIDPIYGLQGVISVTY
jgi:hypothetical protein